jgi:lipocalin/uncharacterized membrane protein YphA (DoxX/SURF4 family)
MFYNFLFPNSFRGKGVSFLLLIIRVFFGILFFVHGVSKMMNFDSLSETFPSVLGFGSYMTLMVSIFCEFCCSLFLIAGLLVRLIMIPMIVSMGVAFFDVHDAMLPEGELSLIYLVVFAVLYITGPGRYSVDYVLDKKFTSEKEGAETQNTGNSKLYTVIALLILMPLMSQAKTPRYDNSVISDFDLSRYLGKWYEIARFDHSFERGMENVTAEYVLRDDGMVEVTNTGWKDGKIKVAKGRARQVDALNDPAQLEVSFFLFFYSDYNVLMLDDNYQVALVGSRSPKYLWILSRTPEVGDDVLGCFLEEAERRGYNTGDLIWVEQ